MAKREIPGGAAGILPWISPEQEEDFRRWKEDPAHKRTTYIPPDQAQSEHNTENRNE
jgi:hypothetical protein